MIEASVPFRLRIGTRPLLVSIPHAGTFIPPALAARLTDAALALPDTDWHVERLYDFAAALGASVLVATHSRYVIDLNRPPDNQNLYPGQDTTGLCPVDTFDRAPLYRERAPDAAEIVARRAACYDPYHAALRAELERLRERHSRVVLWDAHSIRSVVPRFFTGRLPDLNFGTANGASCDPQMAAALLAIARSGGDYSTVLDGRFKGGHITRHYGDPARGTHAVQLEMAQCIYMDERPPYVYDATLAARLQSLLRTLVESALRFAEAE